MTMFKSRRVGELLLVATVAATLSACATAADPTAMALAAPTPTDKPFPSQLQHAMCARSITGGEETNPMWASKVGNDGFKTALSSSLDAAGLLAASDSGCTYPIDANLLGLQQPSFGFDMTVTAHVNYKVYDSAGQPYLLETIDSPYTAKMGDAFAGTERLRLANEGSIRASIQLFFDKLRAKGTP